MTGITKRHSRAFRHSPENGKRDARHSRATRHSRRCGNDGKSGNND